jgi:3-mercaptopyruvate sulfurtransferase SseA
VPKGWRDWKIVLRALQRFGIAVCDEDEKHVFVARFPHRQAIRKWWLAKELEEHLVRTLHLEWQAYLQAIRAVEAEDRGELSPADTAAPLEASHSRELKRGLTFCEKLVRKEQEREKQRFS